MNTPVLRSDNGLGRVSSLLARAYVPSRDLDEQAANEATGFGQSERQVRRQSRIAWSARRAVHQQTEASVCCTERAALGDDCSIAGVCRAFTGLQVGNAAHLGR